MISCNKKHMQGKDLNNARLSPGSFGLGNISSTQERNAKEMKHFFALHTGRSSVHLDVHSSFVHTVRQGT